MIAYFFGGLLFVHGLVSSLVPMHSGKLLNPGRIKIKSIANILSWSAGILFILSGALLLSHFSHWWVLSAAGILLSQFAVVIHWKKAKTGTLLNLFVLAATIVGFQTSTFKNFYLDDVKELLDSDKRIPGVLTVEDLSELPAPVRKYIIYSGALRKPYIHNFKVRFTGKIRESDSSAWMPFSSEQYNRLTIPTRLFFMNAEMMWMPVAGYHRYKNREAMMDIRLFSTVQVQYMDGAMMNEAETVTFFNDMCCLAPGTLIDKRIQWTSTKGNKVIATFTNGNITIAAELYFNEEGQLVNFISNDRYAANAGKKIPWSTPLANYQEVDGWKLARDAQTVYDMEGRPFCYGQFNVASVEYNIPPGE